jgi:hypothetical protein
MENTSNLIPQAAENLNIILNQFALIKVVPTPTTSHCICGNITIVLGTNDLSIHETYETYETSIYEVREIVLQHIGDIWNGQVSNIVHGSQSLSLCFGKFITAS